jgi:steroid 5-alpha reductase family enzyme
MMIAFAGLGLILALATLVWLLSVKLGDASIADVYWGTGFVILAWLYGLLSAATTTRSWLVVALITLWGARLSLHIFLRNRGNGEDPRYRAMRERRGPGFWWQSLFTVFWLQGAILWLVSMPIFFAMRARPASLTAIDGVGIVFCAIGLAFEVIGDYQLKRFKADPANRGQVLDRGLWRYTRHPNYFGDATLWWGMYLIACATPGGWRTMLSPALMLFLLMRVSGVTLLEAGLRESRPGYRDYITRTSSFVPWFPRRP